MCWHCRIVEWNAHIKWCGEKKQIIARFNGHSYAVLKPVITNLNAFNSNHMSNFIIFIHTVCRGFVSLFFLGNAIKIE